MRRVIFLFNHDAGHQVGHLAGIADAFAREHPTIQTVIAFSNDALRLRIAAHFGSPDQSNIQWVQLHLGPAARTASVVLDRILPASRIARLHANIPLFKTADAIVSTERTFLRVKDAVQNNARPIFVRVPHGAGDRNVAYHPDWARYDLALANGQKAVDGLTERGVDPARLQIIGYPKFDNIPDDKPALPFSNDRPTVVYNPHFDPHLSSWFKAGPDLLKWFASGAGQSFNLVFAPHVMLFRKKLHISPEYRVGAIRPDIPPQAETAANIHIDLHSPALFDMTYTRGADIYVGDVSSQIYEFLRHPRPAFFLDCKTKVRGNDEDLMSWRTGPVVHSAAELTEMLPDWQAIGESYRSIQEEIFDYTINVTGESSLVRAAHAIANAIA